MPDTKNPEAGATTSHAPANTTPRVVELPDGLLEGILKGTPVMGPNRGEATSGGALVMIGHKVTAGGGRAVGVVEAVYKKDFAGFSTPYALVRYLSGKQVEYPVAFLNSFVSPWGAQRNQSL